MSEWTKVTDRIVRFGRKWVRVSAVEAVEPSPGVSVKTLIYLSGGACLTVSADVDTVINRMFGGGGEGTETDRGE